MRATYKAIIEPHFRKIRESPHYSDVKTKDAFGFEEVFSQSDLSMSSVLVEFAHQQLHMLGSYSEEHGPYSDANKRILSFEETLQYQALWQFDPIDGSSRFVAGKEGFSMHASLLVKCKGGNYMPLVGLIYDPIRDQAWYNDVRGRLFFDDQGSVQTPKTLEPLKPDDVLRVHCSDSGRSHLVNEFCERVRSALHLSHYEIVDYGAGGAHFAALLRGDVHITMLPVDSSKQWDNANAVALVPLRGGDIRDFQMKRFENLHRSAPMHFNRFGDIAFIGISSDIIADCIPDGIVQKRLKAST
jgi:3'-phosphoadenosine 5'-phosphosulfate (PAPS) 3'-phosphatase